MQDSYDEIAERYDRVWSARFEPVARRIWERVPAVGGKVLDIGTGTGIVLRARREAAGTTRLSVGCDSSAAMLRQALQRTPGLRALAADAACLPFRNGSFDVVTAGFVLSHVGDYPRALSEILRVLKPQGTVAASAWAAASDPYTAAWSECLAEAAAEPELEPGSAKAVPWEEHFSRPGALESALARAGFSHIALDTVLVETDFTVEQFLEDRALSSNGRFARRRLGSAGWTRFLESVSRTFHSRFGSSFRYGRDAFIAIAGKPSSARSGR